MDPRATRSVSFARVDEHGWQKVNDSQTYAFFVALLCAALWYALPLWRRVERG